LLFQCFLIAQHVSGDTPPIIRSSKTVIAASDFTYFLVAGCRGDGSAIAAATGNQKRM
jgi:hypothetical protein